MAFLINLIKNIYKADIIQESDQKIRVRNTLEQRNVESLLFQNLLSFFTFGKPSVANVGIQYGIHMLSEDVTIQDFSKGLQNYCDTNIYISCHHRETIRKVDTCAQYLLSSIFDTYFISVLNACKWPMFHSIFGYIYIKHMKSDQRYWTLVQTMLDKKTKKALCVYPDRSGSLYYGYKDFYFRDGLFAASLFTGLPIVDILVFEPKANKPETTIELRLWSPDTFYCTQKDKIQNEKEYALWRHANKTVIDQYTQKCEEEYKSRIHELEVQHQSCDRNALDGNKICLLRHKSLEFDWNSNRHEFVAKKNAAAKSIP